MLKKIASNTIAQIISKATTSIIAIFLISVLTNYLSVEMYGMYNKIYNYTGIFVFLADLGLYAISIREIAKDKANSSKIVGNVMTLRLFLGIFILVLSTIIAFFLPGYNTKVALLSIIISSIFTIVQLLNSSIMSLMQAYMKIEFSAVSTIVGKIINLGGVIFIAYFLFPNGGETNRAFIAIMIVGVLWVAINTILNYIYAKKICPITFAFDGEYIKHLFKISLPYGVALFLSVAYLKVDVILISIIEGAKLGDKSIALYSLPMKIVEVAMVTGGYYMTSVLPSLSEKFKNSNDKIGLDNLIGFSFRLLFIGGVFLFTVGVLFRDLIIETIANKDYLTALPYNSSDAFIVVFFVVVFYFISLVFIYILIAGEKQAQLLKINIIVMIFNIVGNLILIPKYSFMGAGITTVLSQMLLCILTYYFANKLIKIRLPYLFMLCSIGISATIFLIFG